MSPTVRKFGSATVLMWLVGVFMVPIVAYIASKAVEVPELEMQLRSISDIEKMIDDNIRELARQNTIQHGSIIDELKKNTADIMALQIKLENHRRKIDELTEKHKCVEVNGKKVWE